MKLLLALRTWSAILSLAGALLWGLDMVCSASPLVAPFLGVSFIAFCGGISALAGAMITKSSVEKLANGTGVKGAVAALMTDAKPGEPPTTNEPAVK